MAPTTYHTVTGPKDITVAYAEAGDASHPTLLLLHGFPTSSHQFRNLIPLLSDQYHVLAPDLPGFGHTTYPPTIQPSFKGYAFVLGWFLDALKVTEFGVYIFDYGAPSAFRLALERPNAVKAIISQNGNAYVEGLTPFWDPIKALWATQQGTPEFDAALEPLKGVVSLETTKFQYTHGVPADRLDRIDPTTYTLDHLLNLSTPEKAAVQVGILYDYQHNVALYPDFQKWLRASKVPVLAVWGKNDPFFGPDGAEAYKRDVPDAEVHLLDGGHFLLETHLDEVAAYIKAFLERIKF